MFINFLCVNLILSDKWQRKRLLLFHSVQFLVEMEKDNARWNVLEEKESVMTEPNHNPQQAAILVPVLCGTLEIGLR